MAHIVPHLPTQKSRKRLRWEIAVVLAIKVLLIVLAGIFLFGTDKRLHVDREIMTRHLLAPHMTKEQK